MLNDSGPSLQLNNVTVNAIQHVRVLGVHLSSDLSLDKHVSSVSATCFYHLGQLRRIRRSLDADSAATLVHAFVTSRVDYCNASLAAAPKTTCSQQHQDSGGPPSVKWHIGTMDPPNLNQLKPNVNLVVNMRFIYTKMSNNIAERMLNLQSEN